MSKMADKGTLVFGVFVLSRGVYNLKNEAITDYAGFATDITDQEDLPEWMECDKFYLFRQEDLKKEAKSEMTPFSMLFPIHRIKKALLADSSKFMLKFRMEDRLLVMSFSSAVECWKMYNYVRVLHFNSVEFLLSMGKTIQVNMRVLFDDNRPEMIPTVVSSMININNAKANNALSLKTKRAVDENQINFPALSELYLRMMVGLYSMENPEEHFGKMKVVTEELHKYYFLFIQELFKNPYTDVS